MKNKKIDKLLLAGGGSKSGLWAQIISNCLGIKVLVPKGQEFGAKGAAIISAVAINKNKSIYNFQNKLKIHKKYSPNMSEHKKYMNAFNKYKMLTEKLFINK